MFLLEPNKILAYNILALLCKPVISTNSLEEIDCRQLDCEVSTCRGISRIVYEKKDTHTFRRWTQVFERFNRTYFHALDITSERYSLKNRSSYTDFHFNHILCINPVTLDDQGEWRCVVYDDSNVKYKSKSTDVHIIGISKKTQTPTVPSTSATNIVEKPSIGPTNQALVTNQLTSFTCIIDGIHREPTVVWKINGTEQYGGVPANQKHADGLWFVTNTIHLSFDKIGISFISCVVQTQTRDLRSDIRIEVKEPAKVINPLVDRNITVQMNDKFIINCTGSGYKPNIRWQKDGTVIQDSDERFIIEVDCNAALCTGTLTTHMVDSFYTCLDYIGVYTCVIALEPPYQSEHPSADTYVTSQQTCKKTFTIYSIIGIAVPSLCCMVVVPIVVIVACLLKKRKQDVTRIPEYTDVVYLPDQAPPINPAVLFCNNTAVQQIYAEINDATSNKTVTQQTEQSRPKRYSTCSISDKADENSYDYCFTGLRTMPEQQMQPNLDSVLYKRMDSQGRATYLSKGELLGDNYLKMDSQGHETYNPVDRKDSILYKRMDSQGRATYLSEGELDSVLYKRMDSHGRATYLSEGELLGDNYLKMDSQGHETYNPVAGKHGSDYLRMDSQSSITYLNQGAIMPGSLIDPVDQDTLPYVHS